MLPANYEQKISGSFNKGLHTDFSPDNQPEGSYRFGLNGINESLEGDLTFVSNEKGTVLCTNLPTEYRIIGDIPYLNNEFIVFITNEILSQIGIVDSNCSYTPFIISDCLGFTIKHQIQAILRIRKGCNKTIYFTDNFNPIRSIDLDDLASYLLPGFDLADPSTSKWDCSLFKLNPDYSLPCIDFQRINDSGGIGIKLGTYQFLVQYLDSNKNPTGWFDSTNPIPIVDENLSSTYTDIDGGFNGFPGFPGLPLTNKTISLVIDNLDTSFKYIQIAVIQAVSGDGTTTSAYILDVLAITGSTLNYLFVGIDINKATVIPVAELFVPRVNYDTCKSVTQIDNRLIIGKLKDQQIDYSSFQKEANKICVKYVTKALEAENILTSSKSGEYYYDNRSYLRDEIYALGVVWVFKNGSESPVFHIPGRKINKKCNGNPFTPLDNQALHNRPQTTDYNRWDDESIIPGMDSFGILMCDGSDGFTPGDPGSPGLCPDGEVCGELKVFPSTYGGSFTLVVPGDIDFNASIITVSSTLNPNQVYTQKTDYNTTTNNSFKVIFNGNPIFDPFTNTNCATADIFGTIVTKDGCTYDIFFTIDSCDDAPKIFLCEPVVSGQKTPPIPSGPSSTKLRKWQVYNTAAQTQAPSITLPHYTEGELAFWESCERYPIDRDCNGDLIYPIEYDSQGVPTGKMAFIRHHKMPDTTLEPHFLGATSDLTQNPFGDSKPRILPLGLELDNIVPPIQYANKIQGYKIVRAIRDNTNKTILDKGIILNNTKLTCNNLTIVKQSDIYNTNRHTRFPDSSSACTSSTPAPNSDKFLSLHTPITKFNKDFLGASYIKIERELYGKVKYLSPAVGIFFASYTKFIDSFIPPIGVTNRRIQAQAYVDPDTVLNAGILSEKFDNKTQQETFVAELSDTIISPATKPIDETQDGKDIGIYYGSIKKLNLSPYSNLYNIYYFFENNCTINSNLTSTEIFGGDIFISQLGFRKTISSQQISFPAEKERHIPFFFVESEINVDLRQSNDIKDPRQRYLPKYYNETKGNIYDFLIIEAKENLTDLCINYYSYNKDYSKQVNEKPHFSLPLGFDYCSKCLNKFPYRIAFSESSYQEQTSDNFKIFLSNSYMDIPAHTGELWNLFVKNDMLFCHTQQSIWQFFTKEMTMKTDQANIYAGTGAFFSIPPKELISSPAGYAGSESQWALQLNEFGAIFPSQKKGKIFLFSDSLHEISQDGEKNFFENNLPSQLEVQFKKLTKTDYPYIDNPAYIDGIGLTSAFDSRHKRYIITKRDYRIIEDSFGGLLDTPGVKITGKVYWSSQTQSFVLHGKNTDSIISLDNKLYFENLSFTKSYSFLSNSWSFYHSYLPLYMITTTSKWFTSLNEAAPTKIWEHNYGPYQTYYGKKYPFIFEYVIFKNPIQTVVPSSLEYISEVLAWDGTRQDFRNFPEITFDKVLFYNNYQFSGLLTLDVKDTMADPFSSLEYTPGTIQVSRTERTWGLSNLRDLSIQPDPTLSEAFFTKQWSNPDYQNSYFIDKVPNTLSIDLNKSPFEIQKFRDKYLIARFFFDEPNVVRFSDRKIIVKYMINNNRFSPR